MTTEERKWTWMVGIIAGLGECAWEESYGDLQHLTGIFADASGNVGVGKRLIGGALRGYEQIKTDGLVIFSMPATDDLIVGCSRLWSSIVPANGKGRFRLP